MVQVTYACPAGHEEDRRFRELALVRSTIPCATCAERMKIVMLDASMVLKVGP